MTALKQNLFMLASDADWKSLAHESHKFFESMKELNGILSSASK